MLWKCCNIHCFFWWSWTHNRIFSSYSVFSFFSPSTSSDLSIKHIYRFFVMKKSHLKLKKHFLKISVIFAVSFIIFFFFIRLYPKQLYPKLLMLLEFWYLHAHRSIAVPTQKNMIYFDRMRNKKKQKSIFIFNCRGVKMIELINKL